MPQRVNCLNTTEYITVKIFHQLISYLSIGSLSLLKIRKYWAIILHVFQCGSINSVTNVYENQRIVHIMLPLK